MDSPSAEEASDPALRDGALIGSSLGTRKVTIVGGFGAVLDQIYTKCSAPAPASGPGTWQYPISETQSRPHGKSAGAIPFPMCGFRIRFYWRRNAWPERFVPLKLDGSHAQRKMPNLSPCSGAR